MGQNTNQKTAPLFRFESKMEIKDLRKMTYIATFLRNYMTIPFVILLCFIGNYIMAKFNKITDMGLIIQTFFFLLGMTILLMCFRIEHRNKKRIKYDGDMIINKPITLSFFDEAVGATLPGLRDTSSLPYESFFQLIETKTYFIFYHNVNQVSLLRKKDMNDIDTFRSFIVPKFRKKYKRIKIV